MNLFIPFRKESYRVFFHPLFLAFLLCSGVFASAHFLHSILQVDSLTLCLLLGIILRRILPLAPLHKHLAWIERYSLGLSICLLGLSFDLETAQKLGGTPLFFLFILISSLITLAVLLAKHSKIDPQLAILSASGIGICGSSAIIAVSGIIDATPKIVGICIGAINLIGMAGLAILPLLVNFFQLSDTSAAWLIGGGLPSVSHVAASGALVNTQVADLAMGFKMARILLIIPLVILLPVVTSRTQKRKIFSFRSLPWYVVGFLCTLALGQLNFLGSISNFLAQGVHPLSGLALAAIGLGLEIKELRRTGLQASLVCAAFFFITVVFLLLSSHFLK